MSHLNVRSTPKKSKSLGGTSYEFQSVVSETEGLVNELRMCMPPGVGVVYNMVLLLGSVYCKII